MSGLQAPPVRNRAVRRGQAAASVEQLKARLSDAFDRFLEGVSDNRQVAFDDGWRLKTDPAEHTRFQRLRARVLLLRRRQLRLHAALDAGGLRRRSVKPQPHHLRRTAAPRGRPDGRHAHAFEACNRQR